MSSSSGSGLRLSWLRCRCPARRSQSGIKAEEPSPAVAEEDVADLICRYCFEGPEEDELISPCSCSGGQKHVHLKCLRMWQRAVLVSQPTHPDLYDQDTRQRICQVCKVEFSCRPPTRAELLASFTGAEIAALIEERCFIGSAESFSRELERQVSVFPGSVRDGIVCRNWIRGAFLIVKVVEDRQRATVMLKVSDAEDLEMFLTHLEADARTFQLRGRRFSVLPLGPLRDLAADAPPQARREQMRTIRTPCTFRLRPDPTGDSGEDGIVAVNLTRPFDLASSGRVVMRARQRSKFHAAKTSALAGRSRDDLLSEVSHFIGGPCEEEKAACCLILSDGGYTIVQDGNCLEEALTTAEDKADQLAAAEELELVPISSAAAAGAAAAAALGLASGAGASGEEALAKRRRLATASGSAPAARSGPIRVFVFWGYAGWSRCQLMGEIAKGSWGLCKADVEDVTGKSPSEVYQSIYPRLVFAPRSEMSESYASDDAPEEEERREQMRRMTIIHELLTRGERPGHGPAVEEEDEEDDEEEEVDEDEEEGTAMSVEDADGTEEAEESEDLLSESEEENLNPAS